MLVISFRTVFNCQAAGTLIIRRAPAPGILLSTERSEHNHSEYIKYYFYLWPVPDFKYFQIFLPESLDQTEDPADVEVIIDIWAGLMSDLVTVLPILSLARINKSNLLQTILTPGLSPPRTEDGKSSWPRERTGRSFVKIRSIRRKIRINHLSTRPILETFESLAISFEMKTASDKKRYFTDMMLTLMLSCNKWIS